MDDTLLFDARARVLADLQARQHATATASVRARGRRRPAQVVGGAVAGGREYIAGLVAQDVQDALFESVGRWPLCLDCGERAPQHMLHIQPDLGGPDPVWVCEESGDVVAPLGSL